MKPRHHLYLDADLTAQLEALAAKPGTSKSAIAADALRAYIERRGARAIDDLLKVRLDRITAEQRRTTRNINVVIESLSLFIHYQFSLTAQIPEPDAAARAVGRDRFQKFIDQISRQLASGKTSIGDDGEGAV